MILRKALLKSFCPNLGKLNLSSFTNGPRFSISSTEKKEMIVLTARCEFTFPDSPGSRSIQSPAGVPLLPGQCPQLTGTLSISPTLRIPH